jgi:molybdopterin-containing oxidoreductase family iron-sulfur binding subunit
MQTEQNDLIQLSGQVRRKPNLDKERLDLDAVRERLQTAKGRQMWRSLEELAGTPEFEKYVEDEFPDRVNVLNVDRRQFLKLAGASLALAGVTGCARMPQEKLVPFVKQPEQLIHGVPLLFATAQPFDGYARGVLARSNEGRPTKIEGNPDHPASLGATDVWMQADVLQMYDPDRSTAVLNFGDISSWDAFVRAMNVALGELRRTRGEGLRIVTETITSPTLAEQMATLLKRFPRARWVRHEPVSQDNARQGARLALGGRDVDTIYRFDRASVILSLDSDFLLGEPASVRYARDFSNRRRVIGGRRGMSRLYAVKAPRRWWAPWPTTGCPFGRARWRRLRVPLPPAWACRASPGANCRRPFPLPGWTRSCAICAAARTWTRTGGPVPAS